MVSIWFLRRELRFDVILEKVDSAMREILMLSSIEIEISFVVAETEQQFLRQNSKSKVTVFAAKPMLTS